ncbi:acetyl-CoA carboxylase biotin carboxyl carrier protein [Fuchsiella alkaliacetigena]|uniref:acetyl-CoA carboxylase biotin carboxyl carrier protein n=1 Tax=Fuchsiella alkaliacetigena TaxID=957042 RepID=UPI00200B8EE9|nr:acetyl-CoA carboxylase biotin carboxyl carrier protein [Fuchsiella alkaliacetigena]MCK8825452.1 acetyl-CoA carboxylase biotin carboxyl carrier protein [Fuchsiella alkaliacetigena]
MSKKVKFTDLTLRDGHQSLWATRMKTEDMLPIIGKIDEVGYHSLEVWGGATFDVCMRFLNEDPWERLKLINDYTNETKLQMLLRAQNVVGYKHYPDDVVRAFVAKAVENGVDIFRIFDALNDARNMRVAMEAVQENGAHVQGTLSYTVSPVHTIDHYVDLAVTLKDMGADSICIKDMAGLLKPYVAYDLVKEIKNKIDLPVHLHSHYIGGVAIPTFLKGIEAGADIIDTASASLAFGSSHPPVETMTAVLEDTEYDPGFDLEQLFDIAHYFEQIRKKRGFERGVTKLTDMQTFSHQVPGGMMSNLVSQLKKQDSLDRIQDVLDEIPKVREELGYPPLVTPTSQVVGVQAVFNVLLGERYKVIPDEVKSYIKGYYGRPPAEIDPKIKKLAIGDEEPITQRPADLLDPILDDVREEVKQYVEKEEDYISYALFPQVGLKFLKERKQEKNIFGEGANNKLNPVSEEEEEVDLSNLNEIKELLKILNETDISEVNLEIEGSKVNIKKGGSITADSVDGTAQEKVSPAPASSTVDNEVEVAAETEDSKEAVEVGDDVDTESIEAPMVGTFYRAPSPDSAPFVEVGDVVEEGDTVCIIEAMKLMNEIEVDAKAKIVDILVDDGEPIEYGQPLFLIEEL